MLLTDYYSALFENIPSDYACLRMITPSASGGDTVRRNVFAHVCLLWLDSSISSLALGVWLRDVRPYLPLLP